MARHADLALTEIAGQVRSTAADLIRAAQAGTPDEDDFGEAATDEMLASPTDTPAGGHAPTPPGSSIQPVHVVAEVGHPRAA